MTARNTDGTAIANVLLRDGRPRKAISARNKKKMEALRIERHTGQINWPMQAAIMGVQQISDFKIEWSEWNREMTIQGKAIDTRVCFI